MPSLQVNEWQSRQQVGTVGVYIHTGFLSALPQSLRNVLVKVGLAVHVAALSVRHSVAFGRSLLILRPLPILLG